MIYRIYGNSDLSKLGFPSEASIKTYLAGGIFQHAQGRYRYSQTFYADKIILSRKGWAYGHFEIDHAEDPTPLDRECYPNTEKVFIVKKSTLYGTPVKLYQKPNSNNLNTLQYRVTQNGLSINEDDFNRIANAAGTTKEFGPHDPIGEIERRFCRICYNSHGWRKPDRTADEVKDSYYGKNGFGHEEWLFNYDWRIDGFKYGFLQPFTNNLANYQGSTYSIVLYTKKNGFTLLAGTIRNLYVPTDAELKHAYDEMQSKGWLKQMHDDLSVLKNVNSAALANNEPGLIINCKFRPEDVTLFDPMPEFAAGSKPTTVERYELLHADENPLPQWQPKSGRKRSEEPYLRAAQTGMIVDPAHTRLQNRLHDWLVEKHGVDAVQLEWDCVDLRLCVNGEVTFFEIKTDSSAKRCIRNALGQLFEYSSYPTHAKAKQWIIVGFPPPTFDDIDYLQHLRKIFQLPVYYAQFNEITGGINATV